MSEVTVTGETLTKKKKNHLLIWKKIWALSRARENFSIPSGCNKTYIISFSATFTYAFYNFPFPEYVYILLEKSPIQIDANFFFFFKGRTTFNLVTIIYHRLRFICRYVYNISNEQTLSDLLTSRIRFHIHHIVCVCIQIRIHTNTFALCYFISSSSLYIGSMTVR